MEGEAPAAGTPQGCRRQVSEPQDAASEPSEQALIEDESPAVARWARARERLDQTFGDEDREGTVTTDMVANKQEESLAVTIQRDGKIVVAGYSGLVIALARYNADGTLDNTFDGDGKVISGVSGRAFAVAIDGNDRIVVAGDVQKSNPPRCGR